MVAAIDSKRVELAKLQDRFRYRVDLAPSDIREVATKRVLAKKEASGPVLTKLYKDNQGQLNAALRLERTTRKTEIPEAISSTSIHTRHITSTSASASCRASGSSRGHRGSTAAATERSSSKPTRCSCPTARR